MPNKKRKRDETDAEPVIPNLVTQLNLQPVKNLSFDKEKITEEKKIWLIKAPKNFDPKLLDGIKLKVNKEGNIKTIQSDGCKYTLLNKNSGQSIQQVVAFLPTGEKDGEMTCTVPFTREMHITEVFAQDEKIATENKISFRGIKHKAYQEVPQIKTMGYRLKPAGYSGNGRSGHSGDSTAMVESPVKKKKSKDKNKNKNKKKKKQ